MWGKPFWKEGCGPESVSESGLAENSIAPSPIFLPVTCAGLALALCQSCVLTLKRGVSICGVSVVYGWSRVGKGMEEGKNPAYVGRNRLAHPLEWRLSQESCEEGKLEKRGGMRTLPRGLRLGLKGRVRWEVRSYYLSSLTIYSRLNLERVYGNLDSSLLVLLFNTYLKITKPHVFIAPHLIPVLLFYSFPPFFFSFLLPVSTYEYFMPNVVLGARVTKTVRDGPCQWGA